MKRIGCLIIMLLSIILLHPTNVSAMEEETDTTNNEIVENEIINTDSDNNEIEENPIVSTEPENDTPLVIIRVNEEETQDNNQEIIEETNPVTSTGTMEIVLPENYVSDYSSTIAPVGEQDIEYSKGEEQNQYTVQYKEDQSILGMDSSKEWDLLANQDELESTNKTISTEITQVPRRVPINLWMYGTKTGWKNLGNYYLSEKMKKSTSGLTPIYTTGDNPDVTNSYIGEGPLFATELNYSTQVEENSIKPEETKEEKVETNKLAEKENKNLLEIADKELIKGIMTGNLAKEFNVNKSSKFLVFAIIVFLDALAISVVVFISKERKYY